MPMFSKVSIKSFVYDIIDVFMFPNEEIKNICQKCKINKCLVEQNLTDTDSTSIFFVFICDLACDVREDEPRDIIFEVMLKSKIFNRLDLLSHEYFEKFNCRNTDLKKRVCCFEVESIDKTNIITIALNPKEYLNVLWTLRIIKNIKVYISQLQVWILTHILPAYLI